MAVVTLNTLDRILAKARFQMQVALGLQLVLLGLAVGAGSVSPIGIQIGQTDAGPFLVMAAGLAWLLLVMRSLRQGQLMRQASQLIGQRRGAQAVPFLAETLLRFSVFRLTKLIAMHHLMEMAYGQKDWPAAARLADPYREMPLLIYLAERPCSLEQIADEVNDMLRKRGRCLVVISEGFHVGDVGEIKDAFGHTSFSSSKLTVAQILVNYLNEKGLAAKGAARGNVPGTDQRHSMAYASTVDLEEAYNVGRVAAALAAQGASGFMATILRNPGPAYTVRYDKVPLPEVANSERKFPSAWIAPTGHDVTDDFVKYARPLIGEDMLTLPMCDGRQRMTRFQPIFAEKKLPAYTPQMDRKG